MINTVREYEKAYSEICEKCETRARADCKKPREEWHQNIKELHKMMGEASLGLGKDLIEIMTCGDHIDPLMLPLFDKMLTSLSRTVNIMLVGTSEWIKDEIDDVYDNFWDGVEE